MRRRLFVGLDLLRQFCRVVVSIELVSGVPVRLSLLFDFQLFARIGLIAFDRKMVTSGLLTIVVVRHEFVSCIFCFVL